MTRSVNPKQYPSIYYEILEQCATKDQTYTFPMDTLTEARKFRGHFYSFKSAIRKMAEEARARRRGNQTAHEDDGKWLQYEDWMERVGVWLDEPKNTVEIKNRDEGYYAKLASRAIIGQSSEGPVRPGSIAEKAQQVEQQLMEQLGLAGELNKPPPEGALNPTKGKWQRDGNGTVWWNDMAWLTGDVK